MREIAVVAAEPVVRLGMASVVAAVVPGVTVQSLGSLPPKLAGYALAIVSELLLRRRAHCPAADGAPILPLIVTGPSEDALEAVQASPLGVLSLRESESEIEEGVRQALARRRHIPRALAVALAERTIAASRQPAALLTPREHAVIHRATEGATVEQIALSLHISTSTAKTHLSRVYKKLNVPNRAAAVSRLTALGLLGVTSTDHHPGTPPKVLSAAAEHGVAEPDPNR